jgi:acyl carrier protein
VSVQNFDERVMKVIAQAVPAAYKKVKITPESNLARDLGLDSLAVAMLVFKFEEEFGIEIDGVEDDLDMASLRTVKDVLRVGREIVQKAGGT